MPLENYLPQSLAPTPPTRDLLKKFINHINQLEVENKELRLENEKLKELCKHEVDSALDKKSLQF